MCSDKEVQCCYDFKQNSPVQVHIRYIFTYILSKYVYIKLVERLSIVYTFVHSFIHALYKHVMNVYFVFNNRRGPGGAHDPRKGSGLV